MSETTTKIVATKITLGFSESPHVARGKSFEGEKIWERAASYLNGRPRPALGYYKTDFTIHFADGETYGGRYDIGSDALSLGDHIRQFIKDVVDDGYWDQSEETLAYYRRIRDEYEIGA